MKKILRKLRAKILKNRFLKYLDIINIYLFNKIYMLRNYKKFSFKNKFSENKKTVIIPIIESQHSKFIQMLIIGLSLKIRGCRVVIVLCGSYLPICEIRSAKNDSSISCLKCKININIIKDLFKFETISLDTLCDDLCEDEFKKTIGSEKIKSLNKIVDESIIRHYYGNIPDNILEVENIRSRHTETAIISHYSAKKIFDKYNPDVIIGYMLVYSAWEPFLDFFKDKNVRVVSVTSHFFDQNSQIINGFDLYTSNKRFEEFDLNINEFDLYEKINKFLIARTSGKLHVKKFNNEINPLSKKRKVLFCPNLHWDYGMDRMASLYDSIEAWIFDVVRLANKYSDIEFIIRAHPVERQFIENGSKGICDLLTSKFKFIPQNLILHGIDSYESSYDLLNEVDLLVVMNGTIGLEAMLAGKNVVIVGNAPYSAIKNTCVVSNLVRYESILTGELKPIKPSIEDILHFSYFYFIKTAIKWNFNEKSFGSGIYDNIIIQNIDDLREGKDSGLDIICDYVQGNITSPESLNMWDI